MPKAWFCIPSARPVEQVIPVVERWRAQGYGVALWRDDPFVPTDGNAFAINSSGITNQFGADVLFVCGKYPGYAQCVNFMAARILSTHPEVDWIVTGGDDTFPDPNKTGDEIADDFTRHFSQIGFDSTSGKPLYGQKNTFAVVQCTGDRWADSLGVIIERIAGSPWLGRSWCERAWGGRGPLWPEFHHQFVDEALQVYAQHLGVFLQRPDLTHYHAHALRDTGDGVDARKRAPDHMAPWNTRKHWDESKAIFERLKAENFASCMPIP